jgi:hypothetical protein
MSPPLKIGVVLLAEHKLAREKTVEKYQENILKNCLELN